MILTWRFSSGESLISLKGHEGSVYAVKFLNDGLLASGSADRTIKVPISFSIKIKIIGAYGNHYYPKVWDLATGEVVSTLKGHNGSVSSLALLKLPSPKGDDLLLASASFDKTIKLWNPLTGTPLCLPSYPLRD